MGLPRGLAGGRRGDGIDLADESWQPSKLELQARLGASKERQLELEWRLQQAEQKIAQAQVHLLCIVCHCFSSLFISVCFSNFAFRSLASFPTLLALQGAGNPQQWYNNQATDIPAHCCIAGVCVKLVSSLVC